MEETNIEKTSSTTLLGIPESDIQELIEYQNNIVLHRISAFENAVKIGYKLTEIKAKLPHGTWKDWAKNNISFISFRTIQRYMQVSKNEDVLRLELAEKLDIERAIKWLSDRSKAKKGLPPESKNVVNDAFEKEKEFRKTVAQVKKKASNSLKTLEKARRQLTAGRVDRIPEQEKKALTEDYKQKTERKTKTIEKEKKTLSRYEKRLLRLYSKEEKLDYLKHKREELEQEIFTIEELLRGIE